MWPALLYGLVSIVSAIRAEDGAKVPAEGVNVPDASVPLGAGIPGIGDKLPTTEQLLEMLDSMTSISDADKASLREDLLRNMQRRAENAQAAIAANGDTLTMQSLTLFSLIGVVALVFVFFVYKLFKCLSEREAKREEKKKNKQQKKKK